MFKKLLSTVAAVVLTGALAFGASVPLLTGPLEPSQLLATLNQLITSINTNTGGLLNAQTATVGTTAVTTEEVLQTYTLPANTLASAGQGVRVTCWGATGATANNKTVKLYFGASVISTGVLASNAQTWFLDTVVMRTAAATQQVLGRGVAGTGSITPVAVYVNAGTDNLAAGVVIKCTGTNGTAAVNDVVARGMITELLK